MTCRLPPKPRVAALAMALVLSLGFATVGQAQTPFFPFVEDFATPFDDDPVTWVGEDVVDYQGNVVTTQIDPISGGIVLSNPAQLNPDPTSPYSLGFAIAEKDGMRIVDGNVRARTVVQLSDAETFGSLALRVQDYPPEGDAGAYFANINGAGVMQLGDFLDPTTFRSLPTSLDPVAKKVVLEFQVVDNVLRASAWDAAGPRPAMPPTLRLVGDVARPPGSFGLDVGRFSVDPSGAMATFTSYEIARIPEPASVALLLLGLAAAAGLRQRRRRRQMRSRV